MGNREIEIKVRNINKKKIISKLEEIGAKRIFAGKIIDYRFDTPGRMLSKQGKALRLRKKGKYYYLTLKGKKMSFDNITSRDEIGVRINNIKHAYRILNELGFIKIFELEKYRTEYRIEDCNFDIDEYIGMSPILEIEGTRDLIKKYIKELELNEKKNFGRIYVREILEAKKNFEEKNSKELL